MMLFNGKGTKRPRFPGKDSQELTFISGREPRLDMFRISWNAKHVASTSYKDDTRKGDAGGDVQAATAGAD